MVGDDFFLLLRVVSYRTLGLDYHSQKPLHLGQSQAALSSDDLWPPEGARTCFPVPISSGEQLSALAGLPAK